MAEIPEQEYKTAGVSAEMIDTGAIIITGETATKLNAEQIVHILAKHAGQFVVVTAGADLEVLLAGKGSGAEAYSAKRGGVVVNVDIGGRLFVGVAPKMRLSINEFTMYKYTL